MNEQMGRRGVSPSLLHRMTETVAGSEWLQERYAEPFLETLEIDMFKFEIGSVVVITASGVTGTVVDRTEYVASENSYLVRYGSAERDSSEAWCSESSIC